MFPIVLTHDQAMMLFFGKVILLGTALIAGGLCWRWGRRKLAAGCAVLAVAAALSFLQTVRVPAKNSCIANLKQIDGAVQQWALENNKKAADPYSFGDKSLLAYMKGSVLPDCPQGGRYTAGANVGGVPRCSLAAKGHTL